MFTHTRTHTYIDIHASADTLCHVLLIDDIDGPLSYCCRQFVAHCRVVDVSASLRARRKSGCVTLVNMDGCPMVSPLY